jgi:hypothetical protein
MTIRIRLRDRDLPTDRVTVMHRDLFERARVPFNEGNQLDAELCAMTRAQASALIDQLPDQED